MHSAKRRNAESIGCAGICWNISLGNLCSVMAKVLVCGLEVSKFELQPFH